ncbi:hypothetical protein D3C76_755510 [compost metagenome]
MNLQDAIYQQYGVRVPMGIADGRHRIFKIDQLRNGYLLRLGVFACFGSVIDGESIIFDGERYWERETEQNDSPKIRQEWLIWEAARAVLADGKRLSRADSERLALAVQRLEAWL